MMDWVSFFFSFIKKVSHAARLLAACLPACLKVNKLNWSTFASFFSSFECSFRITTILHLFNWRSNVRSTTKCSSRSATKVRRRNQRSQLRTTWGVLGIFSRCVFVGFLNCLKLTNKTFASPPSDHRRKKTLLSFARSLRHEKKRF